MRMTEAQFQQHQARVKAPIDSPARPDASGAPGPSRNNRGARKKTVDGIVFDSQFEAQQYGRLKLLELAGVIQGLRVHHPWPLMVDGEEVACWESDFDYLQDGKPVIVDAKGYADAFYRLKFKLFNATYKPLRITEIRKAKRYKAG
jgi:hypothetical protein